MTEQDTSLLIQISKDLATNTEATKNIEKHLATLNGKVAHHETRMQASEAAQAITATAVASMQQSKQQEQEAKKEKRTVVKYLIERGSWAIVSVLAIGVWKIISLLITSDIIKRLIQ